mmetsp:Transcript_14798/g.30624  ORF Transcript_14798/g.30624 Transcript_14798/m.30624 type:complete len:201 (-) Transcript_14798:2591-3193(-)
MSSAIVIKPIEEKYFEDVDKIRRTFLNSKHMCLCVHGGVYSEVQARKEYKKCPDLMNVCGVAILPDKGVVGYIHLVLEGMPCAFHKAKPGEVYVAILAVGEGYRGLGVGSALLRWADGIAKERGCTYLSLDVIGGNPAIELYERKGYVIKLWPMWFKVACALPLMCFMGFLITPKGAPNYCTYGQMYHMKKQLESEKPSE